MEARAQIANHTWFDNRSWTPQQPQEQEPKALEQRNVELPSPTLVVPAPGSLDYLRLGCDDLYCDLGGES